MPWSTKVAQSSKRIAANSAKKFFAVNPPLKEKCALLTPATIKNTREPKAKNAIRNVHWIVENTI